MSGLIFIRHAETDLAGRFCGHTDPPLNARGHEQVVELIDSLSSSSIDEVWSSDLRRATETAMSLAQHFSAPCSTTASLREINFGRWEGLSWGQIERLDADLASRWTDSFPRLTPPQGESSADCERRILQEINQLLRRAESRQIAVVTHAGVMRVVLRNLLGHTEREAWEFTKSYCSFFHADATALSEVRP